jgi:hypothetical protein
MTLIGKYTNPLQGQEQKDFFERSFMELWTVPQIISSKIPCLPNKIYSNKDLIYPLTKTLNALIKANLHHEIKTWDGCYNPRFQRGSTSRISIHTWGLAIDFNAAWNQLGQKKISWSPQFIQVWRDNDWICGADFKGSRVDGMHFEWTRGLINE